jgi:hypothetical protein
MHDYRGINRFYVVDIGARGYGAVSFARAANIELVDGENLVAFVQKRESSLQ